ncbi:hypothetical protein [Aquipuribacter nitratireducens]|uniref:Uncharacterized protein n=1 Tax=Aquipuribacter nitratireducens TaxID=650104 RepID=A0ABW0GJY8_9MICO
MSHDLMTVGMLADAELAYRRERLARDVASARGLVSRLIARRRARVARRDEDLVLAA